MLLLPQTPTGVRCGPVGSRHLLASNHREKGHPHTQARVREREEKPRKSRENNKALSVTLTVSASHHPYQERPAQPTVSLSCLRLKAKVGCPKCTVQWPNSGQWFPWNTTGVGPRFQSVMWLGGGNGKSTNLICVCNL